MWERKKRESRISSLITSSKVAGNKMLTLAVQS